MKKNKRGQVWYADFVVGVLMFSLVVFAYFYYVEHNTVSDETLQSTLVAEAKGITAALITQGYPLNWTSSTVETVGLTDGDYRVDLDKLSDFNSWNYEERRSFLHTTKDYYFFFEYLNGTKFNELCKDYSSNCVAWNSSYHLVQNSRLVIYDGDMAKMVLYIYQTP